MPDELTKQAIARLVATADPIVIEVLAEHLLAHRAGAPLQLSDAEQDAVLAAARPLTPVQRSAFFADAAAVLRVTPGLGPGLWHRTLVHLQARYFEPPVCTGDDTRGPHYRPRAARA